MIGRTGVLQDGHTQGGAGNVVAVDGTVLRWVNFRLVLVSQFYSVGDMSE